MYHREVAVLAQVKTQFVIYSREVTMFFIVLICCLTFVVANLVARWLGNLAASCVAIAALVLSLAMMFYSATIMITTVSLTIAGIVCAVRKADSKAFFKWSAVSFAAAMLASGGITVFDIVYMSDLRQQFAFESMGERLSYENNLVRDDPAGLSNQTTQNHLRQLEDQISLSESGWGGFRNRGIGQMHQNMVERFVNSRGFGGDRFDHVGEHWIVGEYVLKEEKRTSEPIAFLRPQKFHKTNLVYAPDDSSSALSMDELWSNHAQNYSNFVYADGFGYIEGRQQVAGFISHGFGKLDFRVNGGTAKLRDDWQLSRLYLVSLLKFETPRVYVSKSLPRMEELKDAATRSLDEFEEEALRRLRNGEDLVVQSRPHRTRLLGSLRAIKQCLDCHNVRRGHLLGAFSYELRRTHSKPANDKRVDRPRT